VLVGRVIPTLHFDAVLVENRTIRQGPLCQCAINAAVTS
jgi:hypothetical protein